MLRLGSWQPYHTLRSALDLPNSQPANNDLAWTPESVILFFTVLLWEHSSLSTCDWNTTTLWPKTYLDCSQWLFHTLLKKKKGVYVVVSSETWGNTKCMAQPLQSQYLDQETELQVFLPVTTSHFKKPNHYLTSYRSVLSAFKLCINGILHAFMPDFFCPVYCCAHHSNSYSNYQDHFAEEETEVYL